MLESGIVAKKSQGLNQIIGFVLHQSHVNYCAIYLGGGNVTFIFLLL